jgi:aspartate ammonia-lyase
VTALNPYIGYANATEIAQQALQTGRSVSELVIERKLLSREELAEILRPENLTRPVKPSSISPRSRKSA